MNWLPTLRDQLPLLLVLSPVIGFLVTYAASTTERDLTRYLAISNCFCSLLIFGGIAWQFESQLSEDTAALRDWEQGDSKSDHVTRSIDAAHEQDDRRRIERLRYQWFAIDGTNLWSTFVLIVLTGLVIWQTETNVGNQSELIPIVLLFESASVAALTAYDLRAFLLASGVSALLMSLMIGRWGGPDRRGLAVRFLFVQVCGGSLVMLGFAMLIVAVPWMKLDVSTKLSPISWNIATIVFEVQKWTSRNELAFQYQNVVFPWMLFVLSLGFAIQFGLFPFHSWPVSVLRETPSGIAVLCLAGILPISGIGWLRFVVPLAPELLAAFDRLILIPSLGGAVWGALRAVAPGEPRTRGAFVFVSLSGVSLLGCYSFTRIGMSGAWLMVQQVILAFCAIMFVFGLPAIWNVAGSSSETSARSGYATRTLLLLLCVPALGLFASQCMILSELLRESLLLVAGVFIVVALNGSTAFSLLNRHFTDEAAGNSIGNNSMTSKTHTMTWPVLIAMLLTAVACLAPTCMLHQCEPEFDRVFRRFEQPAVSQV